MDRKTITAILLAAGESSRMGSPKQQLPIDGQTLLRKSVLSVTQSVIENSVVVLGFQASVHKRIIQDLPVHTVFHDHWQEGIGSSLKAGLTYAIEKFPFTDAALIVVCDQPFVTTEYINSLIKAYQEKSNPIVASTYSGTLGVPALLNSTYFQKIFELKNNQGAKNIILENSSDTFTIDFPFGAVDLDTPDDYQKFLNNKLKSD